MGKRKIFVIGPMVPFTGGIAQSNASLCNNLSKENDVTAISFSLMYPKFLYPGKKQTEGREVFEPSFKIQFILNTINPISWLRVINRIRKEKPSWVVFLWWHTYFFPSYFFIAGVSKFFGAKINFLCHNVLPHDEGIATKLIHKPLTKILFSTANHITTLSQTELELAKKLMPDKKSDFIIENSFSAVIKKKRISQKYAKKILSLKNKHVILFFGAVRPYKGLEDLIEAVGQLKKSGTSATLVIAGAFWIPVEKYMPLIKSAELENDVLIIDKYVPDEEISPLFCAADVVVLSHRSATQSAIPMLAFSYNTPMIATAVGGNSIFVDDKKTGFLVPPASPKQLAYALQIFFEKNLSKKFKAEMRKKSKMLEWSKEKERKFFGEY